MTTAFYSESRKESLKGSLYLQQTKDVYMYEVDLIMFTDFRLPATGHAGLRG